MDKVVEDTLEDLQTHLKKRDRVFNGCLAYIVSLLFLVGGVSAYRNITIPTIDGKIIYTNLAETNSGTWESSRKFIMTVQNESGSFVYWATGENAIKMNEMYSLGQQVVNIPTRKFYRGREPVYVKKVPNS